MLRRTFLSLFVAPVVQVPASPVLRICPVCKGTTFLSLGLATGGYATGELLSTRIHQDWRVFRCQTCGTLRADNPPPAPPA